ncbi:MAG: DUF916 domain-containing protein [Patulibacter sp.]|nr:DUF916 domain-containing protein [Patulibacter sp.]
MLSSPPTPLRRLLLLGVALLTAILGVPAVASAAPTIGGFSARALGPNGDVTPQTYFQETLAPGATFHGELLVTSTSKRAQALKVYSVDGLTGNTTGTVYANESDPRTGASQWITPTKATLHMLKKSDRTIGFTVKVPDDATPGDHVGAIALESKKKPKVSKGQFGVNEIIRVAVAVSIHVTGNSSAALTVDNLTIKALAGTQIPSIGMQLRNTGQLLCRPALAVELSQNGTVLGSVNRQLDTILPGADIAYPLPWPKPLASGTYHAKVNLTGCGAPATTEADLVLKGNLAGSVARPGPNTLPDSGNGGVPIWAMVLGILVALVAGILIARRKPREKSPKQDDGAQPA